MNVYYVKANFRQGKRHFNSRVTSILFLYSNDQLKKQIVFPIANISKNESRLVKS